jgi:hypothetical protein
MNSEAQELKVTRLRRLYFVSLEFPHLSTCSARLTAVKLATQAEKVKYVPWFEESRSAVTLRRRLLRVFGSHQ